MTYFSVVGTSSLEGQKPLHSASAHVGLLDGRIDYMGSCQLMGKATEVVFNICEEWEGSLLDESSKVAPSIRVIPKFQWEEVKLVICKSTTRALVNIVIRLKDFILQQKNRSERTLMTMLPSGTSTQGPFQAFFGAKASKEQSHSTKEAPSMCSVVTQL